jgi:hypothetical protein
MNLLIQSVRYYLKFTVDSTIYFAYIICIIDILKLRTQFGCFIRKLWTPLGQNIIYELYSNASV